MVSVPAGKSPRRWRRLLALFGVALLVTSAVSHFTASWFGFGHRTATYRRVGPVEGPQIFCAGSSLLQFGLSWPEVAERFGQGVENWGVAGSSPVEWEMSQLAATNSNVMIIGFSYLDLNDAYLCDARANIVPLSTAIADLWHTHSDWAYARRILSQYPLAALRRIFPTAGRSDAVLVGLRRKLLALARRAPTLDDQANALVLPSKPVLDFGDSMERLSDWPPDKTLRRMVLLRNELRNQHTFSGPKQLALQRMMRLAASRGRVIVVILPVSPQYAREFLSPAVRASFEAALTRAQEAVPAARFVRLDRLPSLQADELYSDFVHLNGAGRRLANEAFFKEMADFLPHR
jgi:hypothetical protein